MPIPVITVDQMREWEKATWASGQTEAAVIRQAGLAVARLAERMTRRGSLVLALAGKGHNGDDTRIAAEALQQSGRDVQLLRVEEPQTALRQMEPLLDLNPALILDGLFGIGLNRPLAADWALLIRAVNQTGVPILAVDVPSGLDAATGLPPEEAIRATATLTLGAVKTGLVNASAWPHVGRLEVAADIGLIPCPFTSELNYLAAEDFRAFPPPRPVAAHKGSFGHLVIIAGSFGYHGAAVLAARGAQRAQPGLITVVTSPNVYAPVAAQLQSVMVHPWGQRLELPKNCTGVLVGPGLAAPEVPEELKALVRQLWQRSPLAMVIDASALDWLPHGQCPLGAVRLVTPHPGEAGRLLGMEPAEVQQDRPAALQELSRGYGCRVVLKGHQTLIGQDKELSREPPGASVFDRRRPRNRQEPEAVREAAATAIAAPSGYVPNSAFEGVCVNSSGNPFLAQGGSGDLLSGYLAGLLAQPLLQQEPAKTICYGVWQHGAAADALQAHQPGWIIEDLAEGLGRVQPA